MKEGNLNISLSMLPNFAAVKYLKEMKTFFNDINRMVAPHKAMFSLNAIPLGVRAIVRYHQGVLVDVIAEDDNGHDLKIMNHAFSINGLPTILPLTGGDVVIEGIVYINKQTLRTLLSDYGISEAEKEHGPRKVIRNVLKGIDCSWTESSHLRFKPSRIISASKLLHVSHLQNEQMEWLVERGFFNATQCVITNDAQVINSQWRLIENAKDALDYDLQGMTVTVTSLHLKAVLGVNEEGYSKWGVLLSRELHMEKRIVRGLNHFVDAFGEIRPAVIFDPIIKHGSSIVRVVLDNTGHYEDFDIAQGDEIGLRRNSEGEYYIAQVSKKEGRRYFPKLQSCPCCGGEIMITKTQTRCTEKSTCQAQLSQAILTLFSKDALNVRSITEDKVKILIEEGFVNKITDMFTLKNHMADIKDKLYPDLNNAKQFIVINKLIMDIEQARKTCLAKFLIGLGVPGIDKHLSTTIATRYSDFVDNVINLSKDTKTFYQSFPSVFNKSNSHKAVIAWFKKTQNKKLLSELKTIIEWYKVELGKDQKLPFSGLTFYFTNKGGYCDANEIRMMVLALGGEMSYSLTGNVDVVIVDEMTNAVQQKLRGHDIVLWDYVDIYQLAKPYCKDTVKDTRVTH